MNHVLVTGGVGGIGSTIVDRFLSAGFKVIVFDRNEGSGKAIANANPNKVLFYNVDITNNKNIFEITNKLYLKNVRIQHCISLAGGALLEEFHGIESLEDDSIKYSIDLNLSSHIVLAKNILPLIKECRTTNKSIIFISSINALMDFGLPAYSAAKSGLLGITKVLSSELGKYNIRVNSILPGTVITKRTSNEPKAYGEYLKGSLLGRFATSEEIAEVVYSVSEMLTCITGQSIVADCGQTVKGYYENI